MTAAAGATGARTWLQTRHATWLTPRLLRVATIVLLVLGFVVSSVGFSGA